MRRRRLPKFDEIGYWSELKLDIIKEYASAYSRILSAQTRPPLYHVYIDAFAGSGQHISRASRRHVPGSPSNALDVQPPFREYHFIELDRQRVSALERIAEGRSDIHVYAGDCNKVLVNDVFPRVSYTNYRRALCLLDPYGLNLEWPVIEMAGQSKSIEVFLNFPIEAINRNVLRRNPDKVSQSQIQRMNAF